MFVFILIWFGQLISLIGSGLTGFALAVWVFQKTNSATNLGLIYFFTELPAIIVAPIAGAIADRYDRRLILLVCDGFAGISTVAIALLLFTGRLEIWQIYLAMAVNSTCKGFQQPAYFAATSILVKKEHFGRASGMNQLSKATAQLFSPVLAGVLVAIIQVEGVILIDFFSFVFAFLTLLIIRFPELKTNRDTQHQGILWRDAVFGWTYIAARPGLLALVFFFAVTNFTIGIAQVLLTPLVLSFADTKVLGTILSVGGCGWLFGSLVMSTWGGPGRRIHGILGFEFLMGLGILLLGLKANFILIAIAALIGFFSIPIIISSSHAIWLVKVAPDMQGRVFAIQGMLCWSSFPLAYLVSGPLADRVFEPLMVEGGLLANSIGSIIGVGNGRGIGLLFIILGFFIMVATLVAYQYPRLRLVEDELPDFATNED